MTNMDEKYPGFAIGLRDTRTVPLCRFHHAERHPIGKTRFEFRHRLNFKQRIAFLIARRFEQ